MKWCLIDSSYADRRYQGLGAQWLRWEFGRHGAEFARADAADGFLVTVQSQQSLPSVRGALRRLHAGTRPVVIGGAGAYGPAAFDGVADVVCVGEGRGFVESLIVDGVDVASMRPEAWVQGDVRQVVPDQTFPWDVPPILHPDGKYRVFESRGCRHKCLFCQTGWERRHVVHPRPGVLMRQCRELERRGVVYDLVANDAGAWGYVKELTGNTMISARFRHIETWPMDALPRTVRIGVEGVSERLRRAVAKPILSDRLVTLCERMMVAGKTVKLFFVIGLPLEDEADYEELAELMRAIGAQETGLVQMILHAFIPQPAAPLAVFPVVDEYWEREEDLFRRFIDGPLFSRRVNIMKPARYPTRIKNSMMSMAASEAELRRGWWHDDNPNWRVKYVAPPWKMRHMAAVYARRMGRPDAVPPGVVVRP